MNPHRTTDPAQRAEDIADRESSRFGYEGYFERWRETYVEAVKEFHVKPYGMTREQAGDVDVVGCKSNGRATLVAVGGIHRVCCRVDRSARWKR